MTPRELQYVHFDYPVLPHAGRVLHAPFSDPHKLNVVNPTQGNHGITTCSSRELWFLYHNLNGTDCTSHSHRVTHHNPTIAKQISSIVAATTTPSPSVMSIGGL